MEKITKKFKLDFNKSDVLTSYYSQSGQDLFALICLDGKENGTFLDLGCNHPININNTFLLESEFNWSGVSIDIDGKMTSLYDERKTKVYTEDCTKLDFHKIKNDFTSNHIDYLSLDLEPASITFECLKNIPFNEIEFSVITYEHDSYRFGNKYRDESRRLLESFGYSIISSDVASGNNIFEDWYYNPKYVSYDRIKILESNSLEWSDILFK